MINTDVIVVLIFSIVLYLFEKVFVYSSFSTTYLIKGEKKLRSKLNLAGILLNYVCDAVFYVGVGITVLNISLIRKSLINDFTANRNWHFFAEIVLYVFFLIFAITLVRTIKERRKKKLKR